MHSEDDNSHWTNVVVRKTSEWTSETDRHGVTRVLNGEEMFASEPTVVCLNNVPTRDGYSNSLSTLCSSTPLFDLIGFENYFDD